MFFSAPSLAESPLDLDDQAHDDDPPITETPIFNGVDEPPRQQPVFKPGGPRRVPLRNHQPKQQEASSPAKAVVKTTYYPARKVKSTRPRRSDPVAMFHRHQAAWDLQKKQADRRRRALSDVHL